MIPVFLALAAMAMIVDWWSVWRSYAAIERVAKPLVMVLLISVALARDADPELARWLVIGGLAFGLVGDVLLLPDLDRFILGLVAFLIGHSLYIAAFAMMDLAAIGVVGGIAAALVLLTYLGWPILKQVRGGPLGGPVSAYMLVTAAMVVLATATHRWPIAAGGVLFAVSDGLLGWDRFVKPAPRTRVVVHGVYHLGQAGFVAGLTWLP